MSDLDERIRRGRRLVHIEFAVLMAWWLGTFALVLVTSRDLFVAFLATSLCSLGSVLGTIYGGRHEQVDRLLDEAAKRESQ